MRPLLLSFLLLFMNIPVKSQRDNSLVLGLHPLKQNYYVEITTSKGDGVTTPFEFRQQNVIKYAVTLQWKSVESGKTVVEIDRTSDVVVNDKASDLTIANNLAIRASAVLYPLVLSFNQKGEISGVVNFEAIQQRWQQVKAELQEDFYGEGLDRYIVLHDRKFGNPDALIYVLNNDCFLSVFFNNAIYTTYSSEKATTDISFPYLQNTRGIKNTIHLKKALNDDGVLYIHFDGTATDDRSAADLRNGSDFPYYEGEPKAESRLTGAYWLNPMYNVIQSAIFYYIMTLEVEKAIMVKIVGYDNYEKPVADLPHVKRSDGKIYIPLTIYSDMEKDIQRHLNPLIDIKDMTRPDRKHEGIIIN